MRYALAVVVLALALPAALYVHQRTVSVSASCPASGGNWASPFCSKRVHPSWADPVALLIALGGVAAAVGIVFYKPR